MSDLASWLLKRIADDERVARNLGDAYRRDEVRPPARLVNHNALVIPARVLAECEAKRRIIEAHHAELMDVVDGMEHWTDCADCRQGPPCHTVRLLALPYADRLGYQEKWRP